MSNNKHVERFRRGIKGIGALALILGSIAMVLLASYIVIDMAIVEAREHWQIVGPGLVGVCSLAILAYGFGVIGEKVSES